MPKHEFGTVKWTSKQIKAKGLQKLRWYCQLCEKQCKDENGFKCHRMSDSHLRQMEIFENNPRKIMNDYSRKFESAFMNLMKTRYSKTKVLANKVYNDVIHDRQHIHMNATIWTTLTEFIHYLSDTNKCKIENSERGWYIQYIDHEKLTREQEIIKKKVNQASIDLEREKLIEKAIESSKFKEKNAAISNKPSVLLRKFNEAENFKLSLKIEAPKKCPIEKSSIKNFFEDNQESSLNLIDSETCLKELDSKYNRRSSSLSREGY